MCYLFCGVGNIKYPLLLIEWSFTICPTPYIRKQNALIASLSEAFLSLAYLLIYFVSDKKKCNKTTKHLTFGTKTNK